MSQAAIPNWDYTGTLPSTQLAPKKKNKKRASQVTSSAPSTPLEISTTPTNLHALDSATSSEPSSVVSSSVYSTPETVEQPSPPKPTPAKEESSVTPAQEPSEPVVEQQTVQESPAVVEEQTVQEQPSSASQEPEVIPEQESTPIVQEPTVEMAPEVAHQESTETAPKTEAAPAIESQFLHRVSANPYVSHALESAKSLYDATRNRYAVLGSLETSVKTNILPAVITASKPVVEKLHAYDDKLHKIDNLACSGLDALETHLPVLKEKSKTIIEERIVAPVQSVNSTLTSAISGGRQRILSNVETVEKKISYYIAPTEAEAAESTTPATTFGRVQGLGIRLSNRVLEQLKNVQLRSPAQLKEMAFTVDLIQYTNRSLEHQVTWLKEAVANVKVTSTQSLNAALASPQAVQIKSAVSTTAETTIRTINAALDRLKGYVPATLPQQTIALRESIVQRVQELTAQGHAYVKDDAYYKRVVALAEDSLTYAKTVQSHVLAYYATLLSRFTKPAPAVTAAVPAEQTASVAAH